MYCSSCGTQAATGAAYCHKCGARVGDSALVPQVPEGPVTIGEMTFTPGTGEHAGLYTANGGKTWVRLLDGRVVPKSGGRSTGRTVGGVIALGVAALLLLLGWGWFQSFVELQAEGNEFAVIPGVFGLGSWIVAAAFTVWALTLLSRK